MNDESCMALALRLALKGKGKTKTNPLVGAVIAKQGKIIGKGWHRAFGKAHAEINALEQAGKKAAGATLYVTLEPCCHYGKTPPCTKAIISAGINRVVCAMKDPNPLVNGNGIRELRKAGIEMETGLLKERAREMNRGFISIIEKGRPYITLKAALTADGCLTWGNGKRKKITGKEADIYAHKLRAENDAILVGIGTVMKDNPQLTVRLVKGRNPVRIILDTNLDTPINA